MLMKNDAGLLFSAIGAIMVYISGVVVHAWTIIVAFIEGGVYCAVPTAILPCIGWVYWFAEVMKHRGTIMNPYCVTIIAMYFLCFCMVFLCARFVDHESSENKEIIYYA